MKRLLARVVCLLMIVSVLATTGCETTQTSTKTKGMMVPSHRSPSR